MHTIERTAPDGILIVDGILIPWRVVIHDPAVTSAAQAATLETSAA